MVKTSSSTDLDFPKHRFSPPIPAKTCMRLTQKPSLQNSRIRSAESVFLQDWWLIKVNGKDLAVGGFTSRGVEVREYRSSVVAKRHCATTLGTADGTKIMINGLLNIPRSHQNGFPSEVCYQFLHGFPYNWVKYTGLDASKGTRASCEFTFAEKSGNNSFPSLNDLPVSAIRDCILSSKYDALGTSSSDTFENSRASMDSNGERKDGEKSGATHNRILKKRDVGVLTRSMSRKKRNRR